MIRALINCVSKGGNLTLNLSPDAKGHIDPRAVTIVSELGEWLARNEESIRGCGEADFPKPEWGRYTQKGKFLYAHILEQVFGHINLDGLRGRIKNGRLLADNAEVQLCDFWNPGVQTLDGLDDIFFNLRKPVSWTYALPDRRDTVVRFELTDETEGKAIRRRLRQEFIVATMPRDRSLE